MTSKKSRKKAASNASRGFATQSIASKSKNQDSLGAESPVGHQSETSRPAPGADNLEVDKESKAEGAAIHELSPEQLESHLEDADLQSLLEKHGDRVTKDAGRQISRLRTEKRLLRPQADPLILRSWLTDDIMQNVQSCLDDFSSRAGFMRRLTSDSGLSVVSEDVLISRLWTLEKVLLVLNVPKDRVHEAVSHIFSLDKGMMRDQSSIWGLEECLEWLAISTDTTESSVYDSRPTINKAGSGNVPSLNEDSAGMFEIAALSLGSFQRFFT